MDRVMVSLDVRAEDVAGEQEPALHEVVGLLEIAVLVFDDHVAVVAGTPEGGEQRSPLDVAETGQARHLPADAHRKDAALVQPFAVDPEVLRLDMEDVRAELPDEARDVDHLEDQVRRVEVEADRAAPFLEDPAPDARVGCEVVAAGPFIAAEQHGAVLDGELSSVIPGEAD